MEGANVENVEQSSDVPLPVSPSSGSGKADQEVAPAEQIDQPNTDEKQVSDEGGGNGNNMDPKRLKRIAAGREYSQRFRLKQLQHTVQLEKEVGALQAGLAVYSPRIKYAKSHISLLRAENGCLQQKLTALTRQLAFKEAEYEQLKMVRDELKQMSFWQYQAPYAEISQTESYSYQLVNMARHQPGFNQFMSPVEAPSMPNQNWENQFEFGHPDNEDINSNSK